MRPRRPDSSEAPVWGVLALTFLLVAVGVDVHGTSLHPATYETPHPLFQVGSDSVQRDHVEPADSALVPAHEPVLRARWQALAIVPPARHEAALSVRGASVAPEPVSVPGPDDGSVPIPRGPPAS